MHGVTHDGEGAGQDAPQHLAPHEDGAEDEGDGELPGGGPGGLLALLLAVAVVHQAQLLLQGRQGKIKRLWVTALLISDSLNSEFGTCLQTAS